MAEGFSRIAMRNKLIPIVYILFVFYILPFLVVVFAR
jgi:hypothetical protein